MHQKKIVQPRQVCWEPPAAARGWQLCRKQATDGHSPALEKPQMNRAFGKPAARLGANVPFLSTDDSLHILAHLRGEERDADGRGQFLVQGTLPVLRGRSHVL